MSPNERWIDTVIEILDLERAERANWFKGLAPHSPSLVDTFRMIVRMEDEAYAPIAELTLADTGYAQSPEEMAVSLPFPIMKCCPLPARVNAAAVTSNM